MKKSLPSNPLFDSGALLLRSSLGVVLLAHSLYLKLMVFSLEGTARFFETLGLPGWLAYAVFVAEMVGGLLLIFGVRVRATALVMVPILLGATWAHWSNGWLFTAANGGWEYPLFLALVALAVAMIGGGAFAIEPEHSVARLRPVLSVTPNTREA